MSFNGVCQTVHFNFTFKGQALVAGKNYFHSDLNDSIQFTTLRFYLSNFKIQDNFNKMVKCDTYYYLVDFTQDSTCTIQLPNTFKGIEGMLQFDFGIDSATNSQGAMAGVLDPTTGMYWTWQSGYINCKIEGYCKRAATRKNFFQYHIGGLTTKHKTLQTLRFKTSAKNKLELELDMFELFTKINPAELAEVMSPGAKAADLAIKIATTFKTKP